MVYARHLKCRDRKVMWVRLPPRARSGFCCWKQGAQFAIIVVMDKVYEDSLELHRAHHGKLEVKSKVPINDRNDLSLAYTPGVGAVSVEIGKDPKLAREYTLKRNTIAIVSDGSAILGLGNLGPEAAIPVMEGKAVLFKRFANVDAFPICLATQDPEEIIAAVKYIAPVFGGINLEDISAPLVEVQQRASQQICVLHHGPEFQKTETPPVSAYSLRDIEDRPLGFQFHECGNDQKNRRDEDQRKQGKNDIEAAFYNLPQTECPRPLAA